MRQKHRPFAFAAAVLGHLCLLAALLAGVAAPPAAEVPVLVSLYVGEGLPSGAPPSALMSAADVAQPEREDGPATASEAVAPPAEEPPAEPEPTAVLDPQPAPPAPAPEIAPDFAAEPSEPDPARLAELVAALDAREGEASDLSPGPFGEAGHACRLAEWLQLALQDDLQVRAALARIPVRDRSVANALMVWDGDWVEMRRQGGGDILEPVHAAIVAAVRAAPVACRERPIVGPLFIAIANEPGTIVLALGSGVWRGSDLMVGEGA